MACRSCELACAVEHSKVKSLAGAVNETPRPKQRVHVLGMKGRPLPLSCRHCDDPACVKACMAGVMKKSPKTGTVESNPDKCVGCFMCVMVCPYGAITPVLEMKKVAKCNHCEDKEGEKACVSACPTGALFYGEPAEFEECLKKRKQVSAGKGA